MTHYADTLYLKLSKQSLKICAVLTVLLYRIWQSANTLLTCTPHGVLLAYAEFVSAGEEVSLDTQNDLLALVAYRGLGSMWATKKDAAETLDGCGDLSWWPVGGRQKASCKEGSNATQEEEHEAMRENSSGEKLSLVSYF